MQRQDLLSRRTLQALFLVFCITWFGTLDYRKLVKADEGRYAEIAREMAASGDWLTPRLNGLKYFEKPPLQYWATAAAFTAFGEREWTARLWPAATGFLCVLLLFHTGRRLFGSRAGLLAAAVAASSFLFLTMGHFNALDMGLAFFLQLSVSGFLLAQKARTPAAARNCMLLAWAGLALAVLSKGIVAPLLTGAALLAYSLLARDASPWRRLHPGSGLPLFLLIAAPWFIAVSLANPEFPDFFFIHEHVERFLTRVHGRYQPWWYFLPVLAAGALPWTLIMVQAAAGAWRRTTIEAFQPKRFLLVWATLVFAFFSASGSKLPSYILPMLPALALLAGELLARMGRRALSLHLAAILLLAAVALGLLARATGLAATDPAAEPLSRYALWLSLAIGGWFAGTLAALWLVRHERLLPAMLTLAAAAHLAGLGALLGHEQLGRSNSAHYIAGQVAPLLKEGVPFYSVRMYEQTLPFYLRRTVTLVDYRDEMGFGLDQEPEKGLATIEAFRQRWQADDDAFAVMHRNTYEQFARDGLSMRVVAEDARQLIVRKARP